MKMDPLQELLHLRDLGRRVGAIHEGQRQQLLYWPYAVDPQLDDPSSQTKDPSKKLLKIEVNLGIPCEHQVEVKDLGGVLVQAAAPIGHHCEKCKYTLEQRVVVYHWYSQKRSAKWRPTGHYRYRLQELERCVKLLLGDDFRLIVYMNDGINPIFPLDSNGTRKKSRTRPKAKRTSG